jgi:hypothetical protein
MPFKSEAQRKYLYAKEPAVAKKYEKETPKGKRLPTRSGKKSSFLAAYLNGKKRLGR